LYFVHLATMWEPTREALAVDKDPIKGIVVLGKN
jgi:hypothetical protein